MTRKQKKHLARIIAAAVLLALVWFVLPLEGIWQLLAYCVPYFIVGWDVLWGAIRKILHGDLMDEEFLMSVATIGAFVLGDYREAVAVMLFYQIGELFQSYAVGKSRRNISELMDIRPDYANVEQGGQLEHGIIEADSNAGAQGVSHQHPTALRHFHVGDPNHQLVIHPKHPASSTKNLETGYPVRAAGGRVRSCDCR